MIDVNSETWRDLETRLRDVLRQQQMRLEGPLEQPDTDRARGYIRAVREILAMGEVRQRPLMRSAVDGPSGY